MIRRAYYSNSIPDFLQDNPTRILGELVDQHEFSPEKTQQNAWLEQIEILKKALYNWGEGFIAFEYSIPRMGKRVDVVLLVHGLVFVLEFKVGDKNYGSSALDQVMDYALDLKNFHEVSHALPIIPILVATRAHSLENVYKPYEDLVYAPLGANELDLGKTLTTAMRTVTGRHFDYDAWMKSAYKPTPTIIEAAQALYRGHSVEEISRSEAGSGNLSITTNAILKIIDDSKNHKQKAICFVTGVPGAGKTLAGLNIVNARLKGQDGEYAIFLSGNGPLVSVLREALARNDVQTAKLNHLRKTKKTALREVEPFIRNIHHYRDEALTTEDPLTGKITVFDEAQRAWTLKQTASFMKRKKSLPGFDKSEPQFLIGVMDRHPDWAVIICLIGGGQEINTGEAGLGEWFAALEKHFPNWAIYISDKLSDIEYTRGVDLLHGIGADKTTFVPELHLAVSNRSFRSEKVSELVKTILDLEAEHAREIYHEVKPHYPIVLTRDLDRARTWVKAQARGTERYGLLASSGATRLRPVGIDVKSDIEVENWFLNAKQDVRASYALEQAATEFDIQGLELDWTLVAWDGDLRFRTGEWAYCDFNGSAWQMVNDEQRRIYLKNAYRVLLTRARQGMVIFVPEGNEEDGTRKREFYDGTFEYLKGIGFQEI